MTKKEEPAQKLALVEFNHHRTGLVEVVFAFDKSNLTIEEAGHLTLEVNKLVATELAKLVNNRIVGSAFKIMNEARNDRPSTVTPSGRS